MGYPGKNHKSYQTPKRPWEKSRIESETRLVIEYGLRNKREVWKAQAHLRKYRKGARNLLALGSDPAHKEQYETKKEELISHLQRAGLLGPDAGIDDVLSLKIQTELERRLQTVVYRRGLARSPKQARQLITHGHIAIAGRRVNIPGYHVTRTDGARSPITARPRSFPTPIQKKYGLPSPHQTPSQPPVAADIHGEG
jgi:small subunit ribosomal protein S4